MTNKPPEFVFAGNMQVSTRLTLIAGLAIVGITLQMMFSVFLGWLLVLGAVLLGTVKGKSNEPEMSGKYEWKNVTLDEFNEARNLLTKVREVKASSGPLSASVGCLVILALGLVLFILVGVESDSLNPARAMRPAANGGSIAFLFVLDAVTLLAPIWVFGRVKPWQPPKLDVRMLQLSRIYELASNNPEIEFQPSLLIGKTAHGSVPTDCRLTAKLRGSDKAFMGIQMQVTLNSVQGTMYPYTYAVLIANPEFGLISKANRIVEKPGGGFMGGLFADANAKKEARFPRFRGSIVELKREGDVEIAVVRQQTSGKGYTTAPDQAAAVFENAYMLAKRIAAPGR